MKRIVMIAAALAAILIVGATRSAGVTGAVAAKCETREIALDDGYGVSAVAMRDVCD